MGEITKNNMIINIRQNQVYIVKSYDSKLFEGKVNEKLNEIYDCDDNLRIEKMHYSTGNGYHSVMIVVSYPAGTKEVNPPKLDELTEE